MSDDDLKREIESLRQQLGIAQRKVARVLARQQQHALAMEVIRQNNEDLDKLAAELATARKAEAARTRELEGTNQKLLEQEHENRELIVQLQDVVTQLSTPLLRVGHDILALPIVGALDEARAVTITERILQEITATRAACVILDVTGVATMDAPTTEHIIRVARATQLLGARCILCGIQPSVASSIATLGLELDDIETVRNLHQALDASRRPKAILQTA